MDQQECRKYLDELRARERECERLMKDTGGMMPSKATRQVHAMAAELRQLAIAIAGVESELKMRDGYRSKE